VLILENYYSPDELADQLDLLIEYYNNDRYHEALQNLTPADARESRKIRCFNAGGIIAH
jgi:transposase InsO family protein